jgi:hypothetical protein
VGDKPKGGSQPPFKFELVWLLKDGFFELVSKVLSKENKGASPTQRWKDRKVETILKRLGKEYE